MEIELIHISPVTGIIEGMKTSRRKEHIENIPEKIFNWGHWSVLEHSSMTVQIHEISRACCYDNKTEILTNDGWKAFTDVQESDEIITLNSKNQQIEIQKPVKIINEHYRGKMYLLQSSKIDLCVTPNHRMYIYPFDTQRARKQGANGRKNPDL